MLRDERQCLKLPDSSCRGRSLPYRPLMTPSDVVDHVTARKFVHASLNHGARLWRLLFGGEGQHRVRSALRFPRESEALERPSLHEASDTQLPKW